MIPLRPGSIASARGAARAGLFAQLALAWCAAGCGDGDVIGDGGVGTRAATSVTARCGDGVLGGSEQCDDGNTAAGDGCSASCARENPPAPDTSGGDVDAAGAGGAGVAADAAQSGDADAGMDAGAPADGADASAESDDAGSEDGASAPPAPEPLCPAEPPGPCEACNCEMCRTELDACTNLAGDASEGPAQGTSKAALCEALVRCGRSSGCRSIACVCTMENQASCLTGATPPDGPCKDEVLGAAETTDMATFIARATSPDMGYAVAVASAVSTCANNACTAACAAP